MLIPSRSSSITHALSGQASAQARQRASLMWLCTQRSALTVGSRALAAIVSVKARSGGLETVSGGDAVSFGVLGRGGGVTLSLIESRAFVPLL